MSGLASPMRRCALGVPRSPWAPALAGLRPVRRAHAGLARRGALRVAARAVTAEEAPAQTKQGGGLVDIMLSQEVPVTTDARPGRDENDKFQLDWSVQFWRDFRVPDELRDDRLPAATRLQAAVQFLRRAAQEGNVFESARSLAYWTYHFGRTSFFSAQGIGGVAWYNFLQSRASGGAGSGQRSSQNDFFNAAALLNTGIIGPLSEAAGMFHQDYENIKRGIYKMPWDFATPGHRQTNPIFTLSNSLRFFQEAGTALMRRARGQPDPVWLESGLYPDYYLNTWHFQTDGWLSDTSAKVYEYSTETVFVGRQDAMQRQSLVPLHDFMTSQGSRDGAGLQLLEVASGTGRFATFIKDNYPRLGVTQLELSPFYLLEARKNMDYWRKMRAPGDPEASAASRDRFLQAAAEEIPVPDASHDVVVSVYLFHELPEASRRAAVAEMARVLKPGGMAILTDGNQLGDRPLLDARAGNFQAFNEPNWGTHIATDYAAMFEEHGLKPYKKVIASSTKVLSFLKPLDAGNGSRRSSNGSGRTRRSAAAAANGNGNGNGKATKTGRGRKRASSIPPEMLN